MTAQDTIDKFRPRPAVVWGSTISPREQAALAYREGYVAALNDCEREDVGALIRERDAAVAARDYHEARADIAERRLREDKENRARETVQEQDNADR